MKKYEKFFIDHVHVHRAVLTSQYGRQIVLNEMKRHLCMSMIGHQKFSCKLTGELTAKVKFLCRVKCVL